jgi:hypothetical protein
MSLISELGSAAAKLAPAVLRIVVQTLRAIAASPDPLRAAKRAAIAATSEEASEAALKELLGRKR